MQGIPCSRADQSGAAKLTRSGQAGIDRAMVTARDLGVTFLAAGNIGASFVAPQLPVLTDATDESLWPFLENPCAEPERLVL